MSDADAFKQFWDYKKDPKRLEEVASRMACNCGLQKPGSNRQRVVGPVSVIVGKESRKGVNEVYIHCQSVCMECHRVHRLAEKTEVMSKLLESLPELT